MANPAGDGEMVGEVRIILSTESRGGPRPINALLQSRFGAAWVDPPWSVITAQNERTGEVLATRRFRLPQSAQQVRTQLVSIANEHASDLRAGTFDWQSTLNRL